LLFILLSLLRPALSKRGEEEGKERRRRGSTAPLRHNDSSFSSSLPLADMVKGRKEKGGGGGGIIIGFAPSFASSWVSAGGRKGEKKEKGGNRTPSLFLTLFPMASGHGMQRRGKKEGGGKVRSRSLLNKHSLLSPAAHPREEERGGSRTISRRSFCFLPMIRHPLTSGGKKKKRGGYRSRVIICLGYSMLCRPGGRRERPRRGPPFLRPDRDRERKGKTVVGKFSMYRAISRCCPNQPLEKKRGGKKKERGSNPCRKRGGGEGKEGEKEKETLRGENKAYASYSDFIPALKFR